MAEQLENVSKSQQEFVARLKEHTARAKVSGQKIRIVASQLQKAFTSKEECEFIATGLQDGGRLQADLHWVVAMTDARIPFSTILQVWDVKDQNSRDSRERNNPQAK